MKFILLRNGAIALVDDEDYDYIKQRKWSLNNTGYATSSLGFMHRVIIGTPTGMCTDHINHDKLDNRKSNLRICTKSQNQGNLKIITRKKSSKYKGVSWCKKAQRWMVKINDNGKQRHVGVFKSEIEAAKRYDKEATLVFGEFALINGVEQ